MTRPLSVLIMLGVLVVPPVVGQDQPATPVVAVTMPITEDGLAGADAVSESVYRTLSLTVDYLAGYRLGELPVDLADTSAATLDDMCRSYELDSIIFGRVDRAEEGGIRIAMGVYDALAGDVTVEAHRSVSSLLGIFDASDEIVTELIEGFAGIHVEYGSLAIEYAARAYDVHLVIDGRIVSEAGGAENNPSGIARLVAGEHDLLVQSVDGYAVHEQRLIVEPGVENRIVLRLPLIDPDARRALDSIDDRLAVYSTLHTDDASRLARDTIREARELLAASEHPGAAVLLTEYAVMEESSSAALQAATEPLEAWQLRAIRNEASLPAAQEGSDGRPSLSDVVQRALTGSRARFLLTGSMQGRTVRVDTEAAVVELMPEIGEAYVVRVRAPSTHPDSAGKDTYIQLSIDAIDGPGRYLISSIGCDGPIFAVVGGELTREAEGYWANCLEAGTLEVTGLYERFAGRLEWTTNLGERFEGAFDIPLEKRHSLSSLRVRLTLDGSHDEWIGLNQAHTVAADRHGDAAGGARRDITGLQLLLDGDQLGVFFHLAGPPEEDDEVWYQINVGPIEDSRDVSFRYRDGQWTYMIRAESVPGRGYDRIIAEGTSVMAGDGGIEARVPLRELGFGVGDLLMVNAHVYANGAEADETPYTRMRF